MSDVDVKEKGPTWAELEKVIPLISLSKRRVGMKFKNVLKITEGKKR
jgi:hypothetical protein